MQSSISEIKVDYDKAVHNHMRNKVEEAVQFFIQGESGCAMTIFPQALNPFLKSLESMGAWRKAIVLPYHDNKNKPLYVIMKIDEASLISSVKSERSDC